MGNWGLSVRSSVPPMDMNSRRNINDQNGEKEKEELKKQLSDLDLYDDGMTADEMRERLKFVDESKLGASYSSGNNSSSPSEVIGAVISPTSLPLDNRTISNPPTKTIGRDSTSPETLDDSYSKRWSQQKDNDSADESIFGPSRQANVDDSVRARKVAEEPLNRNLLSQSPKRDTNVARRNHSSQDMKTYFHSQRTSKLMDSFDVLDCKALPNDVPLKPRCPPQPRQKLQIVDGKPVIPDDISARKLAYLTEMANLAHSWKTKLVCNEFSWGPPIKAGIANGSLDQFPHQEELPDNPEPPGQSCMIMREINATGYSSRPTVKSTNSYHFPDSDDDFIDTIKRKKTPKILSNRSETPRQFQPKKNPIRGASEETTKNVISLLESIDDKVEQTNSTPNGRKRTKSASPEYPEEVPMYPRRILPPIPGTSQRSRRKIPASATRTKKRPASSECSADDKPKRTTSNLSEQEIEDLISDDEEPETVNCSLPPTKRLNQGMEYLKKARLAADEEKQKREKEAKLIADQETREKMERVQRRINERDEKKQQQETNEKSEKEREDRYRNLSSITRSQAHVTGTFQKRTELESEGPRLRTLELPSSSMEIEIQATPDVDEGDMFADSGYEAITAIEAVEQPVCPICGKNFPLDEIENHAANCNDFAEDKPRDDVTINAIPSSSSRLLLSKPFVCDICKFTTQNENVYREHFSECLRSLTDEGSKSSKSASPILPNRKLLLRTHDDEVDQTGYVSSSNTDRKKTPRNQSRKRKL